MKLKTFRRMFVHVPLVLGGLLAGMLLVACSSSQLYSQNIVSGTITVKAGGYYSQSFSLTSNMAKVRVVGTFDASGGQGNHIELYVLDEKDYTAWTGGQAFSAAYNSGRSTRGNVNISLASSGTYYIVFSNTFNGSSSKQVTTRIDMTWQNLQYP